MTQNMTIAETLNKAADLIQERGWTKGSPGMCEAGPHCALGAISAALELEVFKGPFGRIFDMAAASVTEPARALEHYVLPFIDGAIGLDFERVWRWNDGRDRTATEVIEALRACAVIAESRETVASTHTAGLPGSPVSA